ncbi:hypothetical protein PROFUN_06659 [Planoprotostelium fungivorum]|uniref:Cytochrome c oxidase assembly factor 3 n=1 Tax=Planoprotostelium fungivorum TaxID=1890364 RepID=A0A2P6MSX0_9EUKA|nr:hypothetical protein PROFUN_06659 [Planoprotostelium fungivorum]
MNKLPNIVYRPIQSRFSLVPRRWTSSTGGGEREVYPNQMTKEEAKGRRVGNAVLGIILAAIAGGFYYHTLSTVHLDDFRDIKDERLEKQVPRVSPFGSQINLPSTKDVTKALNEREAQDKRNK